MNNGTFTHSNPLLSYDLSYTYNAEKPLDLTLLLHKVPGRDVEQRSTGK